MGRMDEHEKTHSCTYIKIAGVAVLLAVTGILIWRFAPIDDVIDSVLPTFNTTTSDDSSGVDGDGKSPASSPTPPPMKGDQFEFMKCADPLSGDCCNGLDNGFCDLRVDEVMFATSHNANADFESGFLFSPNHQYKLEDSLPAGYRAINVDACNCGGQLQFCHGVCSFGTRDIVEVLMGINDFLDENPSEIIILPIELNSDVDQPVDLDEFYSLMQQVPGFVEKFYSHPDATTPWPTMGELVSANERLILFHSRGPSCDEQAPCPPGLHPYDKYAVNTQWQLENLDAAANFESSCTLTDTPSNETTFFGLNNFVIPPVESSAQIMNEYNYLTNRMEACSTFNGGLDVNFVYVDFWSEGDLPRLVQDLNAAKASLRRLERP